MHWWENFSKRINLRLIEGSEYYVTLIQNFNSILTIPVGTSYQTTNYDRMTEELGREMTAVPPVRPRGGAQDDRLERDDVLYFSI